MGIVSSLIDLIVEAFQFIKNLVERIINGVLNFAKHVLGWFQNIIGLNQNRHVPFIADKAKFREALKTAPLKDVGLFKGVYDKQTDEIVASEYVGADSLDQQTKNILGNNELVVLN